MTAPSFPDARAALGADRHHLVARSLQALKGSLNSESSNPSPTGIAILDMGRILPTHGGCKSETIRRARAGAAWRTARACKVCNLPNLEWERSLCHPSRAMPGDDRDLRARLERFLARELGADTVRITSLGRSTEGFLAGDLSLRGRMRARRDAHDPHLRRQAQSRSPVFSSRTISSPSSACCTRSPTIRFLRRRRRGSRATQPCWIGPST